MTGLVRKAAVLAACGIVFGAAIAAASVPSPGNSTFPAHINLIGTAAGVPDSVSVGAKVSIIVRDVGNNPVVNSTVVLDFSGDVSDVHFGMTQPYHVTNVNCGNHTVYALTDGTGAVNFDVVGGGQVGAAHAHGAGKIYADGVLLGSLAVSIYDEDGASGVGGADLSKWSADFFGATNPERSDFDGSGAVGGADLSLWSATFFGAHSTASAAAASYCP